MPYSNEIVKKARERLAMAKADRESVYNQHLAQAYERLPRLREIDMELRQTMAQAARTVFTQGGDAVAAMEEVKQKNLALQSERAALVAAHLEKGYLDDSPICAHCGGTGYIGSQMCECLKELCCQEQKRALTLLTGGMEHFSQFRLDYYPGQYDSRYKSSARTIMEKTLTSCRTYAATFSQKSENLLFSGDTGLGKTFLSACISRVVAERGYSVAYESASHLFSVLERARFSNDEEARRESAKYTACDLLILDDLGTELPSQFVTAALYSLINDRLLAAKPTIISTNLSGEDFARRYSTQIASRLKGSYRRVTFVGEDIRIKLNQEP